MNHVILNQHIAIPCDLVVYDEIDSTNSALKRYLKQEGKPENKKPLAVIADRQTAGRGRLERSWVSPAGGVYLSLLLALEAKSLGERLGSLALVVACAAREALSAYLDTYLDVCLDAYLDAHPSAHSSAHSGVCLSASLGSDESVASAKAALPDPIAIKWPNDIMIRRKNHEGKLAGILIETVDNARQIIIGIGVNVTRLLQETDERAVYLSDLLPEAVSAQTSEMPELSREIVAARIINAVCAYVKTWEEHACSAAPFKDDYEAHLTLMGKKVVVRHVNGNLAARGLVLGVNEQGQLLVQDIQNRGEPIAVSVSDVTLRDGGGDGTPEI